jgi:hypothetical protein
MNLIIFLLGALSGIGFYLLWAFWYIKRKTGKK